MMPIKKTEEACWLCRKDKHGDITECPLWEDAKELTIARLQAMPENMRIMIL